MRPLPDRPSLFLRAFYFCYFAAGASLFAFLVLYYEELGLPGPQIGLLAAIPPLTLLVAAPVWGGLADATRQHHRLHPGPQRSPPDRRCAPFPARLDRADHRHRQ